MSEESSNRFQRFLRRVRDLDDKSTEYFGRVSFVFYRRLVRIAARYPTGWIGLLLIAVTLAVLAATIARYASRQLAEPVFFIILYIGFYIYICIALVLALVRRQLHRNLDESHLAALRLVGRVVLTIIGTAVFFSPFAWIAWRALTR